MEDLKEIVQKSALPPASLEVEITESLFLEIGSPAMEMIKEIAELGLKISIDDFGTGYSSFVYLRELPSQSLKIDYSFVKGLPASRSDADVVMAIVSMARNLNKNIVAEGVERAEQLAFLMGLGVNEAQGFYFAPGLPPEKALEFLKTFSF